MSQPILNKNLSVMTRDDGTKVLLIDFGGGKYIEAKNIEWIGKDKDGENFTITYEFEDNGTKWEGERYSFPMSENAYARLRFLICGACH